MKVLVVGGFIALILGGLVGQWVVEDAGYVLINYKDTILEMSLWVALMGLFALYGLIRLVSYSVRKITQGQLKAWNWHVGRRHRVASEQTVRGVLVLAEQRWGDARKLLSGSAPRAVLPVVNYMGAARAAHGLQDRTGRDKFLAKAVESTPSAKFATLLVEAEYAIDDGQLDKALGLLRKLRDRAPKHGAVLAGLAACYEARNDWPALRNLLPEMKKASALAPNEFERMQSATWRALLMGGAKPTEVYKSLPANIKSDKELMLAWVSALNDTERADDAEHAVRLCSADNLDDDLVALYGNIESTNSSRQLSQAQKWHKASPDNPAILLAMGRLCLQTKQFELAREHFENSLRLAPSTQVYGELGRLVIALGDERRGTDYLLHAVSDLTDLPQPEAPVMRKTSV